MTDEKLFRLLIIINIASYFFSITLPLIDGKWLSEKEADVLSYLGYDAIIQLPEFIHWIIMVSWFLIIISMYFFISYSRHLYFAWVFLVSFLAITSGMSIMTPYDAFLSDIGSILDGAILAMAYFSRASRRFEKRKNAIRYL